MTGRDNRVRRALSPMWVWGCWNSSFVQPGGAVLSSQTAFTSINICGRGHFCWLTMLVWTLIRAAVVLSSFTLAMTALNCLAIAIIAAIAYYAIKWTKASVHGIFPFHNVLVRGKHAKCTIRESNSWVFLLTRHKEWQDILQFAFYFFGIFLGSSEISLRHVVHHFKFIVNWQIACHWKLWVRT